MVTWLRPEDRYPYSNLGLALDLKQASSVFKSKENFYWENTVNSNSSNPKKLWQSVSTILGKPANQSSNLSSFSASDFLTFLEQKVESVRTDTAGSAPPVFTPTTCSFNTFTSCSQEMVRKVIGSSAAKSCDLDPAPTFLVKEFLDPLLPFLTRLCNVSLQEGRLPSSQTTAIVTPALKKPGLDPSDMKNYRPISNLSFMSKVVERIVVRQLSEYLAANSLLPKLQSGFRRHHSTESALLRVLSDLFMATDKGEVSLLALLDVSAAFDTVDHSILLDRLSISYGIAGSALDWMWSFIVDRTQTVHYGGLRSRCAKLKSGVAQGSVLGPLLYVLYTADIQKLVQSLGFDVHLYADDTVPWFLQAVRCCRSCSPLHVCHLCRERLDVVKPAQTKHRQNPVHLAGHGPRSGQTRYGSSQCDSPVNWRGQQSGGQLWLWASHGTPGEQTVPGLLFPSATITNSTPIINQRVVADTRSRVRYKSDWPL